MSVKERKKKKEKARMTVEIMMGDEQKEVETDVLDYDSKLERD